MRVIWRHPGALVAMTAWALASGCAGAYPLVQVEQTNGRPAVHYRLADQEAADQARTLVARALGDTGSVFKIEAGSDPAGFSVLLAADQRANMYPLVAPLGEGRWLVHAPTLLPGCLRSDQIGGVAADGSVVEHVCDPEGYVWLGVAGSGAEAQVAGPHTSSLRGVLADANLGVLQDLEARLGPSGARSAAIAVVVHEDAPASLVAHVARDGAVIFEARPGFEPLITEEVARTQIRPLLRHEAFHRWNMAGAAADGTVPAWVYEGTAEYVGGLLSLHAGDFSALEHDWVLSQALNQCREALGGTLLADAAENRRTNYDCGRAAAWLLDLDLRRQGADIFAFWRSLLAEARQSTGEYSYVQWRGTLDQHGWETPALDDFLSQGATDGLAGVINARGGRIVLEPSPHDLRRAILEPLLAANCTSDSYGFFDEPGRATLDADTVCPALPAQAVLHSVAGVSLFDDPAAALEAAQARCAGEQEITVGLAASESVRLRCSPISSPAGSFQVQDSGVGPEAAS